MPDPARRSAPADVSASHRVPCPPDRCPSHRNECGVVTNIIPGQSDTYHHLQARVTDLLAESGLSNPQSFIGQQVTITGTIAQVVGPHAFTITEGGGGGGVFGGNNNGNNGGGAGQGGGTRMLLVVYKGTGTPTPGSPVEVVGTLQPTFNIAQAQSFAGGNLNDAAFTAFNNQPYLQAQFAGPVSANLMGGNGGGGLFGGGGGGNGGGGH